MGSAVMHSAYCIDRSGDVQCQVHLHQGLYKMATARGSHLQYGHAAATSSVRPMLQLTWQDCAGMANIIAYD